MASDNATPRMQLQAMRASAQRIVRLLEAGAVSAQDQSEAILEAQAIDLAGSAAIDGLTTAVSALGDLAGDI